MERKLPEGWRRVKLGNIVKFEYGKSLPANNRDNNGTIPVYGSNGIVGHHSESLIDGPSLIIGRKGSIGEVHLSIGACWPIDTTYFIRAHNNIDIKFLYYILKTLKLDSLNRSTAIPGLNRNDAYSIDVFQPPIETQRRIVAILDKAEETRKLRAQADELASGLIQIIFLEMFGDPLTNQVGWRLEALDSLCDELYRYPTFYGFNYVETGIPVVRISNIFSDGFLDPTITNYAFIDEEINKRFPRTILELNDILMAVRGDGSTAKRIGLVNQSSLVGSNISPNLIRFKTNENKLNSIFFFYLLTSPGGQRLLEKYVTRTAKKTITAGEIKRIKIICPPVSMQHDFEQIVRNAWSIKQEQERSKKVTNNLLKALMQKAFTGELAA